MLYLNKDFSGEKVTYWIVWGLFCGNFFCSRDRIPSYIYIHNLNKKKTDTSDKKVFEVLSDSCGSKNVDAVTVEQTTTNDDGEEVKTITKKA